MYQGRGNNTNNNTKVNILSAAIMVIARVQREAADLWIKLTDLSHKSVGS